MSADPLTAPPPHRQLGSQALTGLVLGTISPTSPESRRAAWHDALCAAEARYDFSVPSHIDRFRLRVRLMGIHAPRDTICELIRVYGGEPDPLGDLLSQLADAFLYGSDGRP